MHIQLNVHYYNSALLLQCEQFVPSEFHSLKQMGIILVSLGENSCFRLKHFFITFKYHNIFVFKSHVLSDMDLLQKKSSGKKDVSQSKVKLVVGMMHLCTQPQRPTFYFTLHPPI